MPRIEDRLLDSVFYLYPTVEHAREGRKFGGSGFLACMPSKRNDDLIFLYGVTNRHVVRGRGGAPVVRLNTTDGGFDVLPLTPEEWIDHPDADDLVAAMLPIQLGRHKVSAVSTNVFVTHAIIAEHGIGPGDEAFMIGRFVTHDGEQRNLPTVRFGNISMMPGEAFTTPDGLRQESFLVEIRSLVGYSGSPVFVHIPVGSLRPKNFETRSLQLEPPYGPWLLGVNWGHTPLYQPVQRREEGAWKDQEDLRATSLSGQIVVVPAWRLLDLLNVDYFARARDEIDERIAAERACAMDRQTGSSVTGQATPA